MRILNLPVFAAVWCISLPAGTYQVSASELAQVSASSLSQASASNLSQASTAHLKIRRDDAVRLVDEAHRLSRQVKTLTRMTNKTIAAQSSQARRVLLASLPEQKAQKFDLEVKESEEHSNPDHPRRIVATESQPVLQNYANLMARYHAALSAYIQHRQEVQQHAAAFHAAAQQQNSQSDQQPVMMMVPPLRQIEVQTQDACDALQQAEVGLHGLEEQLNQAVEMMMNNRKSLSVAQYNALWSSSEQKAAALQSAANSFDQGVVAKQGTIQSNMHGKMQEAMRDGDYVLSQKVYGEQQRSSALLHEEVKRGTMHSQMAMMLLNRLQALSPYAGNRSSSSTGSNDPNQFLQDDRSLASEYAQVQALYQQVQDAEPKFHK